MKAIPIASQNQENITEGMATFFYMAKYSNTIYLQMFHHVDEKDKFGAPKPNHMTSDNTHTQGTLSLLGAYLNFLPLCSY